MSHPKNGIANFPLSIQCLWTNLLNLKHLIEKSAIHVIFESSVMDTLVNFETKLLDYLSWIQGNNLLGWEKWSRIMMENHLFWCIIPFNASTMWEDSNICYSSSYEKHCWGILYETVSTDINACINWFH